ncbi:hypothetical protein JNUCC64_24930 [Streptomyces sp. JNUCC 64]
MRDRIAHVLVWVLAHLPLTRRARPGRHTADHLTQPEPVSGRPVAAPDPDPWRRPWTGPSSAEALAIFRAEEARYLSPEQRERFYATAFAERGYDYPYLAEGVHQAPARPRTSGAGTRPGPGPGTRTAVA